MKSYFLEGIASADDAVRALRAVLPGQEAPWLLLAGPGDPIAYFNVEDAESDELNGPAVVADVSGRHWDKTDEVVATLAALRARVGGVLCTDGG